jgi:hypothetical protein
MNIPSEEWADYIGGKMDLESAHNFKQLAWVQLSQFYLQDVHSAIEEFTLCEELGQSVEEYGKYLEENRNRINFIRLVAETKVYALLEQWNREEIKKERYMEDQEKLVVLSGVTNQIHQRRIVKNGFNVRNPWNVWMLISAILIVTGGFVRELLFYSLTIRILKVKVR